MTKSRCVFGGGVAVLVVFVWVQSARPSAGAQRPQGRRGTFLVLDLEGNGRNLSAVKDGVGFDIDGNGMAIQTAWTAKDSDDAFLVLDLNGNGRIDNGREIVSDGWDPPDGQRVGSVADVLVVLQGYVLENVRGSSTPEALSRLDRQDVVYNRLQVWTDANHNGQSEASELRSLSDASIKELGLRFRILRTADADGNWLELEGFFQRIARGVEFTRRMVAVRLAR